MDDAILFAAENYVRQLRRAIARKVRCANLVKARAELAANPKAAARAKKARLDGLTAARERINEALRTPEVRAKVGAASAAMWAAKRAQLVGAMQSGRAAAALIREHAELSPKRSYGTAKSAPACDPLEAAIFGKRR